MSEKEELKQWLRARCLRLVLEDDRMYLVSTLDWYKFGFEYVDEDLGEEFN